MRFSSLLQLCAHFLVNGTKQEWTESGLHEPLSLVAVQFCLSSQEAQDLTTGEDPLDVSVGDNRQLVDVLAAHEFKCLDGRRIRGNRAQLGERAHHTLHASLRPGVASDCFYLMSRDQSGYPVILDDDEAAASGPQNILVDKNPAGSNDPPP
jgi:hypothetical protein